MSLITVLRSLDEKMCEEFFKRVFQNDNIRLYYQNLSGRKVSIVLYKGNPLLSLRSISMLKVLQET